MANTDINDMTPEAQAALSQMRARLAAQGYNMGNPISGFRTYSDQQQLYANMLAGRRGQPLPYPDRGAVSLAARPGYSPHEFGVAFDTGLHGPALAAANQIAPSLGISTVAGDPGHFQLANWRMNQPLGPNDQPPGMSLANSYANPAPVAPAANAIASAAAPGNLNAPLPPSRPSRSNMTLTMPQLLQLAQNAGFQGPDAAHMAAIAMAESGGNPGAVGRAGEIGLTQINPHAWGASMANAARDPQGAFNAARQVFQQQGWGAWSTDPSSPNFTPKNSMARFYNQAVAATPAGSPGIGGVTGPIDPTIAAGGPGAAGTPMTPSGQPPTWQQTVGNAIAKVTQPQTPGAPGAAGQSPLQQLQKAFEPDKQDQGGGGDQQAGQQMQQAMGAQPDPRLMAIAQQSPQLMAAILARSAQPLTWAARPYGSDAGPQIPGTTLTSMGG